MFTKFQMFSWRWFFKRRCEHCREPGLPTRLESSRTIYHHTRASKTLDPNAPLMLCPDCADEHHKYWDEMWKEVEWNR